MSTTGSQQTSTFLTAQALRGIAALSVVAHHAQSIWGERIVTPPLTDVPLNLSFGVDIFFVLSGFVMVLSSQNLIPRPEGWREFMRRRLLRIVPLYWLVTLIKLAILFVVPVMVSRASPSILNIACSFLFIPSFNELGEIRPVVSDGWTLNFEMMFYLLFAAALFLRISIFKFMTAAMAVLCGLAALRTSSWPGFTGGANLIVVDFLFGMAIAALIKRGCRLSAPAGLLLILASLAIILGVNLGPTLTLSNTVDTQLLRLAVWGLPSALIVFSAVAAEANFSKYLPKWCLLIGDASYSIYLIHPFILPPLAMVLVKFHVPPAFILPLLLVAGLAVSTVVGILVHRFIELPMVDWCKKIIRPAGQTPKLA